MLKPTKADRGEGNDMSDLATRIEQATGPDRELSDEILRVFGWRTDRHGFRNINGATEVNDVWLAPEQEFSKDDFEWLEEQFANCSFDGRDHRPHPTASIDAAMTLIPEGWPSKQIGTTDDGVGYAALAGDDMHMMAEDPDEFWVEATAATPALALCAAAIRARS